MKKAKDLGKKNEGKEFKKKITKDKAAKTITKEINSRAKLSTANEYLQKENKKRKIQEEIKLIFSQLNKRSSEELLQIYRRLAQYLNGLYDFSNNFTDLTIEELLNNLNEFEKKNYPGQFLNIIRSIKACK
jgi:hypothetical protein